jgi:hypothetical protein
MPPRVQTIKVAGMAAGAAPSAPVQAAYPPAPASTVRADSGDTRSATGAPVPISFALPAAAPAPTSFVLPMAAPVDSPAPALAAAELAGLASRLSPLRAEEPLVQVPARRPQAQELAAFARSSMPTPPIVLPERGERAAAIQLTYPAPAAARYPANERSDGDRDLSEGSVVAVANEPARVATAPVAGSSSSAAPMAPMLRADPPAAMPAAEQQRTAGPDMGHVFLDGHLVGRWMREHLAQMAARAPSGGTGFDMKLGTIWPGAPVHA